MSARFIAIVFTTFSVLFATGCATREVVTPLPGKLTVGFQPTYAENKQILSGSLRTEETRGPGYRSSSSYDATKMGYTLGRGTDRRECTSSEEHFRSKYSGSYGVTKSRRDGYDFWCYPAPEAIAKPQVVPKAPALPTPTPLNATCGDFVKVDALGLLVRSCFIREELANGRLSCLTGWDEEHSIAGVLQKTGIDSAKRVCSPKAATAPTSSVIPVAPQQQPRPNFGRKAPV